MEKMTTGNRRRNQSVRDLSDLFFAQLQRWLSPSSLNLFDRGKALTREGTALYNFHVERISKISSCRAVEILKLSSISKSGKTTRSLVECQYLLWLLCKQREDRERRRGPVQGERRGRRSRKRYRASTTWMHQQHGCIQTISRICNGSSMILD